MTNNDRRFVAIIIASAVILGSMVPNYVNIAAFFGPVAIQAGVWWMAWLGALVYDAAWLFGSWAHITGGGGRATRVMLIGGVVCAVGINVRQAWLVAEATGVGWTVDALAGHALLPVAGLLAVHGLAHYLRIVPADAERIPGGSVITVGVEPSAGDAITPINADFIGWPPVAASEPRKAAPAPKPRTAPKRGTRKATGAQAGQEPEWYARARALAADGMRPVDIAAEVERSQTRVSRVLNGAAANGAGGG